MARARADSLLASVANTLDQRPIAPCLPRRVSGLRRILFQFHNREYGAPGDGSRKRERYIQTHQNGAQRELVSQADSACGPKPPRPSSIIEVIRDESQPGQSPKQTAADGTLETGMLGCDRQTLAEFHDRRACLIRALSCNETRDVRSVHDSLPYVRHSSLVSIAASSRGFPHGAAGLARRRNPARSRRGSPHQIRQNRIHRRDQAINTPRQTVHL